MSHLLLPTTIDETPVLLKKLTDSLGLPRDILASDEEIHYAWQNLPREMARIPRERLSVLLARMCVAVSTGLFDSAINYAWNSAILELRNRVRAFGLSVIPQIISKSFDEEQLNELKDSDLLELCVSLNLINEEGFFFLNQCREVRNNFSAAHPPMGTVDDREFILFLSRCTKYALAETTNPKGVDTRSFLTAIKAGKFTNEQSNEWVTRILDTHESQRETLFGTLHGMFCDPGSSQETRLNAQVIAIATVEHLTPRGRAELVDRHSMYLAKGETDRHKASSQFLERLGLLTLLSYPEMHTIISNACKSLMSVHNAIDNFHNEPPFAKRLLELSQQGAVPESIQSTYVETVVTCGVGNAYGVSWAASSYYHTMIKNFSPREISLMLSAPDKSTILADRIRSYPTCKERFRTLFRLIEAASVPVSFQTLYTKWSI